MKYFYLFLFLLTNITFSAQIADISHEVKAYAEVSYDKMLIDAAQESNTNKLKIALLHNANPNYQEEDEGATALHWFAYHGNDAAIDLLLESGAKFEICDKKSFSPFHWAIANNQIEIISKYIFDVINYKSKNQLTLLEFAISRHRPEIFELLLRNNAERTVTSKTWAYVPPHSFRAVTANSLSTLRIMINYKEKEFDTNQSYLALTPLHMAASLGNHEIIKLLVENGADINWVAKEYTVLTAALLGFFSPKIETFVRRILEESKNELPKALQYTEADLRKNLTSDINYYKSIRYLFKKGATLTFGKYLIEVQKKLRMDELSLGILGCINNKIDFGAKLLEDLNSEKITRAQLQHIDDTSMTPLFLAVVKKKKEILRQLLNYAQAKQFKIDLSYVDNDGDALLTLAKRTNDLEIVDMICHYLKEDVGLIGDALREHILSPLAHLVLQFIFDLP